MLRIMRAIGPAVLLLGLAVVGWVTLGPGGREKLDDSTSRTETTEGPEGAVLVGRTTESAATAAAPAEADEAEEPASGTIAGRVLLPDRAPVVGVWVVVHREGATAGHERRVRTDAEGGFAVEVALGGGYWAYVPNRSGRTFCRAGEEDLILRVSNPSAVDPVVRILMPNGRPVPRVRVEGGPDNLPFWETLEVEGGVVAVPWDRGDEVRVDDPRDTEGRPLNLLPAWRRFPEEGELVVRLRPGRRVTGCVRTEDGSPLPGLHVDLRAVRGAGFVQRQSETDEEGRFESIGVGRPEDHLRFTLRAPEGYLPVHKRLIPPETSHVEVVFVKGRDVSVRVLDAEGQAVSRALVLVLSTWQGRHVKRNGTTDAAGRVTLFGVSLDGNVDIRVGKSEGKRAWPQTWFRDLRPGTEEIGTEEITLRLEKGVAICGEIRGAEGRPVAGAWVYATGIDDRTRGTKHRVELGRAPSTFVLGPLLSGRYRVTARVATPYARPRPTEVDAPAEDLVIVAPFAVALSGAFLDDDVRNPQIRWFAAAGRQGDVRTVDFDHAFTLGGLREERGILYAFETGTDRCWFREDVRPSDSPFEIRLTPGLRISGRVEGFDARTAPWTGLTLRRGLFSLRTSVSSDGTFTFRAVPPGTYELAVWPNGRMPVVHRRIVAGSTDLVLPMPTQPETD